MKVTIHTIEIAIATFRENSDIDEDEDAEIEVLEDGTILFNRIAEEQVH